MIKYSYYEALNQMKNIFNIRKKMVEYALENGISAAANNYGTTRKTVRKWVNRYILNGTKGLKDRSRAPNHSPLKMGKEEEERIIQIRRNQPYLGAIRIKYEHKINRSPSAIHRVIKEARLTKPRKKKYKVKKDLREVKKKLKEFEKIQTDVKELKDIPQYYPYILKGFPKYQFTARDVRTGICFISFAYEKSATNMGIFALYVCNHLKKAGVNLSKVEFQSDNGSEFIGSWNRKRSKTPFEIIVGSYKAETTQIPPGRSTYNSDVEASHRLIEDELYDMEDYKNKIHFLSKAFTYILYFNYLRKFRYKGLKSPIEILKEINSKINIKRIGNLKPIILDSLIKYINFYAKYESYCEGKGGYHVPSSDREKIKKT